MASAGLLTCVLLACSLRVVRAQNIRCFDCNSGNGGWNTNCPENGDLYFDRVTSVECQELCFVRTHIWHPGTIFRGCSSGFWLPRPLPTNGCMTDSRGDNWCFCDSEECNTMAM
ncbi:uncharacterized protein LOC124138417 [Haliotis rufescens]|uniref:uncharacterized protein LOC124138417 n=1 Tax=Haliotis rufescens TaxID=6454 RepID=UPI00201ED965|nr:uncharacterized protein LOC124138417 [Haliotis rufescens]